MLNWTPHPILDRTMPPLSTEEMRRLIGTQGRTAGETAIANYFTAREDRIRLADTDPLRHGFEPECWADADAAQQSAEILANFGGNRTGKSFRAGKRLCESAMTFRNAVLVVLGESEASSIQVQQKVVWSYLKPILEPWNGRRHPIVRVNYNPSKGFADRQCTLPNGTEIWFLTYNQNPGDYEGWEFGARVADTEKAYQHRDWLSEYWGQDHHFILLPNGHRALAMANGRIIQNIGWWADEAMPMVWLEMLARRGRFRRSAGIWAFTPIRGLTPAMKDLLGAKPLVHQSRPAALLPAARLFDCPPGHMPYVATPTGTRWPNTKVIWFHYDQNPFGGYAEEVARACQDKNSEYVERIGYGYARDLGARMFPNFGPWNVVKRENLPRVGTLYFFTDPHASRRYACIWVLVTPGNPANYYIYRDWPDLRTYGEWAVLSEKEMSEDTRKGWDGDIGPAQQGEGWGVAQYKRCWERCESFNRAVPDRLPHQLAMTLEDDSAPTPSEVLRERIQTRYMDARFASAEHAGANGGTCLLWEFEKETNDPSTGDPQGRMLFTPSTGEKIDPGLGLINGLLEWNRERPMMPHINAPKLYVSEDCQQVIWALANYTGRSGETGASKDFVDLVRHLACAAPRYVSASGTVATGGGGSY